MERFFGYLAAGVIAVTLAGCGSPPVRTELPTAPTPATPAPSTSPMPAPLAGDVGLPNTPRSRWLPARWEELPGWQEDPLHEAWEALLRNCERPGAMFAKHCPDVRRLSIADGAQQRAWLMARFQPYRLESAEGQANGLLTSYYEPIFDASRARRPGFETPLYAPAPGLENLRRTGRTWFTRREIETMPEAREALKGREIAWLADPVDAMVLHIQGSGRLRVTEADGTTRTVRVAFAASNEQPYQSIGRWLLDQGLVRDATWPGIKAWLAANRQRTQELMWANPRYIFFREEALPDPSEGPRGAQGVPLTAGRSVAIDPQSVPYGTPLWMVSDGPTQMLRRLVVAQDTGSAIVGAVRADFFAGTGDAAGQLAGRTRQNLRMWALWPLPQRP